jgi:hypothetical protein
MRTVVPEKLEQGRVLHGKMASTPEDGMMGAFIVIGNISRELHIISSGPAPVQLLDPEYAWEHDRVSIPDKTPTWSEMCWVKYLFWLEDECVMQLHPPRSEYVNHHPYCLHLWKPINQTIPMPPTILIGPKVTTSAVAD